MSAFNFDEAFGLLDIPLSMPFRPVRGLTASPSQGKNSVWMCTSTSNKLVAVLFIGAELLNSTGVGINLHVLRLFRFVFSVDWSGTCLSVCKGGC